MSVFGLFGGRVVACLCACGKEGGVVGCGGFCAHQASSAPAPCPVTETVCPGVTTRSVLIPASPVSVTMYEPAAPDTTEEKKLARSEPR